MSGTLNTNYVQSDLGTNLYLNAATPSGNVVIGNSVNSLVTFTNTGNIGVGTNSPTSGFILDIQAANGRQRIESTIGTNEVHQRYINTGGTLFVGIDASTGNGFGTSYGAQFWHSGNYPILFGTNNLERMRIDASGNVSIGTASSQAPLSVSYLNSIRGDCLLLTNTNTGGYGPWINFYGNYSGGYSFAKIGAENDSTGATLRFHTADTSKVSQERMRIDNSGNLLVGKTTASGTSGNGFQTNSTGTLSVVTAATTSSFDTYELYSTGAAAYRFYITADGVVHATSASIAAISDERLKENVRDLDFGLDKIMAVKPRKFDWKEGKGLDRKNDVGFIAQEFETVFPNSVVLSKAGEDEIEYKSINQSELIPTLVKAIQELNAKVESQAETIAALQAKVGV